MKKFSPSFLLLLSLFIMHQTVIAQPDSKNQDPRKWSIDPRSTHIFPTDVKPEYDETSLNFVNPNQTTATHNTKIGKILVSPNFRVRPSTGTQSEVPISRHPNNPLIMFASSNSVNGSFISEGVYVTTDGGTTWFGNDTTLAAPINNHGGDPAPAIDHTGRFYQSYLGYSTSGMYASYSTNNGLTWANTYTIVTGSQDKNHTFVNDVPSSPYFGRVYVTWSLFTASNPPAVVAYSTNQGVSYTAPINVHTVASGHYAQGVNGAIAPNGDAYITWQNPISSSPYTGDYIGFAKSTDGGATWSYNNNVYQTNGIRGTLTNKASIRVNDFPWMGVDRSGGPRNGWIYIVTAEKNLAPAGSDPDIVLHRSTDGGTTWSAGVRVNQDAFNNGKDQYMPCLHVDNFGGVNIVYYDSRNTANDSAEVYVSRSVDGGFSFTDILVSDHRFKPKPISGLATGYQGDYIGITSQGSNLWPYWADDFSGKYQAWITKVTIADYPLNPFNLVSPAENIVLTSFPNGNTQYIFNWDTSASTASYKWIFGNPTTTPRKISLIASTNSLQISSGQLDAMLASLGVAPGDSLVGQWDVWAYRNNPPNFDSLKSANGPRAITLKRGIPSLVPFSLLNPPNDSRIVTSVFNNGPVNINWRRSGEGVTYKWKFGSDVLTNPTLNYPSNNSGFDTTLNFINSGLDLILGSMGLAPGDSIVGQWAVWAYNGLDSLKSVETFGLTLKRQAKGDYLIAYDSTNTACRASKDSVSAYLNSQAITFDLFNRGSQTSTNVMTFRGYKAILWLGEGTSVMSVIQKDSIKAYLNNPVPGQKSKLIIYSEDIGYQFGRSASSYYDLAFMNQFLGANYVLDRPSSGGNQGLVGLYINVGQTDSTVGTWPDVLSRFDPPTTYDLYKFRADNSINAVGKIVSNYNVATFGVDLESLRRTNDSPAGSSISRFLKGGIDFVNEAAGGLIKTLNLTALVEGMYNGTTSVSDTLTVELRNVTSPYSLLESKKILMNTVGTGIGSYSTVADGTPFFIVLKHRNGLETWAATGKSFSSGTLSYDFTTDSAKAFGFNVVKVGTKWCIYSGDVNRDGIIDLTDVIAVDVDNISFATGYLTTDINGDNLVDLGDLLIADNNNLRFISKIVPTILEVQPEVIDPEKLREELQGYE